MEMLSEADLERVREPVEIWSVRQDIPHAQNPPPAGPRPGEAISRLDLADSELELRVVSGRGLDLDMPLPATMSEPKIEAVAVARVIRLAFYRWQHSQPYLRDPGVSSYRIAPELCTQEAIRLYLTDNSCQIDTGPLLVPDFDLDQEWAIDRLEMAHVAFNHKAPDLAEFILRQPTPVIDEAGRELCQVLHYSKVRVHSARNTLLAGTA